MKESSFFDAVEAINSHRLNDRIFDEYDQYMINRQFSYFPDTIFQAASMNITGVPDQAHFCFYFNSVRPKKRFTRWGKKQVNSDVDMIRKWFKLSTHKAKSLLYALSEEQIQEIRDLTRED